VADRLIPREIIETPLYQAEASQLGFGAKELDEKLKDLLFVIARVPEEFPTVGATGLRVAHYTQNPSLRLYFTSTPTHITLLSIERVPLDA